VTVLYVPLPGHAQHPLMGSSYANLPQARLVQVDGSKHFVMLDQPQRMIDEIEAFMRPGG
jgi:pimeloyl-ACP methyl ester carboxylesterase